MKIKSKSKLIGKEIKCIGGTILSFGKEKWYNHNHLTIGKKYKVLDVIDADIIVPSDIEGENARVTILLFDKKILKKYWGDKITKKQKQKSLIILMRGGSERGKNWARKEYAKLKRRKK